MTYFRRQGHGHHANSCRMRRNTKYKKPCNTPSTEWEAFRCWRVTSKGSRRRADCMLSSAFNLKTRYEIAARAVCQNPPSLPVPTRRQGHFRLLSSGRSSYRLEDSCRSSRRRDAGGDRSSRSPPRLRGDRDGSRRCSWRSDACVDRDLSWLRPSWRRSDRLDDPGRSSRFSGIAERGPASSR